MLSIENGSIPSLVPASTSVATTVPGEKNQRMRHIELIGALGTNKAFPFSLSTQKEVKLSMLEGCGAFTIDTSFQLPGIPAFHL